MRKAAARHGHRSSPDNVDQRFFRQTLDAAVAVGDEKWQWAKSSSSKTEAPTGTLTRDATATKTDTYTPKDADSIGASYLRVNGRPTRTTRARSKSVDDATSDVSSRRAIPSGNGGPAFPTEFGRCPRTTRRGTLTVTIRPLPRREDGGEHRCRTRRSVRPGCEPTMTMTATRLTYTLDRCDGCRWHFGHQTGGRIPDRPDDQGQAGRVENLDPDIDGPVMTSVKQLRMSITGHGTGHGPEGDVHGDHQGHRPV